MYSDITFTSHAERFEIIAIYTLWSIPFCTSKAFVNSLTSLYPC